MRRLLFVALILAPLGSPCFGMPSDVQKVDDNTDKELNAVYDQLMAHLKTSHPAAALALRDAERNWIEFRDKECEFRNQVATGDAGMSMARCLLALKLERMAELKKFLALQIGGRVAADGGSIPELGKNDPIRISAEKAAESVGEYGEPGHQRILYLKIVGDTAYALLDIDRDGWAGVSFTINQIHPVVEKALLKYSQIRKVVWDEAPGKGRIHDV